MTRFKVTGYCPCKKCCGKIDPISASRSPGLFPKRSIAAPKIYPFGTRIKLEGYGIYVVEDRGGSVKDNRIEMFFSNHQQVLDWGVKFIEGTVL